MNNFLQSVRGFVGFLLFVLAVLMTFDGFPGALLSWFGGGVVTVGYSVAIATIAHTNTGQVMKVQALASPASVSPLPSHLLEQQWSRVVSGR